MRINIFNTLILTGIIQGIIFAYVVLSSSYFKSIANKYLAISILALSLNNLNYWFWDTGLMIEDSIYFLTYFPWQSFFPVAFFIFILRLINHPLAFKKRVIFYLFLPFVISSIILTIIKLDINLFDEKLFYVNVWANIFYAFDEYFSWAYSITLGVIAFFLLKKRKETLLEKMNDNEVRVDVDWLIRLFRIGLALCILWGVVFTISLFLEGKNSWIYYPLWIGISVLFYWIGYQGLFQFRLAQDRIGIRKLITKHDPILESKSITNKKASGLPKGFNDTRENKKFKELERLLQEDNIYRNPNLNLTSLAAQLDINITYLSKLINRVTGMSFSEYVTSFRIGEAKSLLTNSKYYHYKIMAVGMEAGFTRASFYRVFKKHTGLTPNEYKNEFLNSSTL